MAGRQRIRKRDTWRERMIRTVAGILEQGEPSKFRFEAECRHSIRHDLCLEGVLWAEADQRAASVVTAALDRLKAVRPTWDEGQLEHTKNFEINRTLQWTPPEFLSVQMEHAWAKRVDRARECAHCGRRFAPRAEALARGEGIYCSKRCTGAAKLRHQERTCEVCGELFRPMPTGEGNATRYCSTVCAGKARTKPRAEVTCGICCTIFIPTRTRETKFCSPACGRANARRAMAEKRALAKAPPAEEEPLRRAAE